MVDLNHPGCTGCGVCALVCPNHCLELAIDPNGEYRPRITGRPCISCGLCERKCIAVQADEERSDILECCYGYANDPKLRFQSTSGGVFYAIAQMFIKRGGVVAGAAFGSDGELTHIIAGSECELQRIRGSKYLESNAAKVFPEVQACLEEQVEVLFSGVPCEISALKRFLGKKYDNLTCCEVFCHGAPRVGIFKKYLRYLEKKYGKMRKFEFRSKRKGWDCPSYEICLEKKTIFHAHEEDIYHLMFGYHDSLRQSCFQCAFRSLKRGADISLGDFWGIEKYYPEEKVRAGISAVLINTEQGKRILNSSDITTVPCRTEEIFDKNRWMVSNFEKPKNYARFTNDYKRMTDGVFIIKWKFMYKIVYRIQNLIGRFLR